MKNIDDTRLLEYLADGFTVPKIATDTGINVRTLETRVAVLRTKHNCSTTLQLVAWLVKKKAVKISKPKKNA